MQELCGNYWNSPRGVVEKFYNIGEDLEAQERIPENFEKNFFDFFSVNKQMQTKVLFQLFAFILQDADIINFLFRDNPDAKTHLYRVLYFYIENKNEYPDIVPPIISDDEKLDFSQFNSTTQQWNYDKEISNPYFLQHGWTPENIRIKYIWEGLLSQWGDDEEQVYDTTVLSHQSELLFANKKKEENSLLPIHQKFLQENRLLLENRFFSLSSDAIAYNLNGETWIIFLKEENEKLTMKENCSFFDSQNPLLQTENAKTALSLRQLLLEQPSLLKEINNTLFYPKNNFSLIDLAFVEQIYFLYAYTTMNKNQVAGIRSCATNEKKLKKIQSFMSTVEGRQSSFGIAQIVSHSREGIPEILSNPVALPDNYFSDLNTEVESYAPETPNDGKEKYFPVGGSKEMEEWRLVMQKKKSFTKPLDILTWMLWLENQGQSSKIVLCASMQKNNWKFLFPETTDFERRRIAQEMEKQEKNFYEMMKKAFRLENIVIEEYEKFATPSLSERSIIMTYPDDVPKFERQLESSSMKNARNAVQTIKTHPFWKTALEKLTHHRLNVFAEENEVREYALEEIVWILAHQENRKISHINEAKLGYDPIAFLLLALEKNTPEAGWANEDEKMVILKKILAKTQQELPKKISDSFGEQKKYWQSWQIFLFGQTGKEQSAFSGFQGSGKTKNIDLPWENFFCPSRITSQSFGKNNLDYGGTTFSDPYRTLFYHHQHQNFSGHEKFPQIPFLQNFSAYSSFFQTLKAKEQEKYLHTVFTPLIREFLVHWKTKDPEYYQQCTKELESTKYIIGIMDFVYRRIIMYFFIQKEIHENSAIETIIGKFSQVLAQNMTS